MKSYDEMIQFTASECTAGVQRLRHYRWTAYILLAETYGVSEEQVCSDINAEIESRMRDQRVKRRAENRASNEARRLANLAKQAAQ